MLSESNKTLSISEIQKQTGIVIERRTLVRWLSKLIDDGTIERLGEKRGTAYRITVTGKEKTPPNESAILSLIAESKEALILVDRPLIGRTPVGYERAFLERYQPNVSSYLTDDEKKKLAEWGKTARQDEPAGTYAKDILQRLLIDLSWNSSRLEGNTYSLLDTERLIAMGEVADNKSAKDAQMILNHKEAIEFIVANSEDIGFNRYTILNIHALLSNNLLPDPAASGRLRKFGVGIQQSVYNPFGIPQVIEEMFNLMLKKATEITDPFEQAFFMKVQLAYLQPFVDVNKRVSRLATNISLTQKNLIPISFVNVPDSVYIKGILAVSELNRIELLKDVFLWAYERSSARYLALRQSLGEPDPFRIKYRDAIRSLIADIVPKGLRYKDAVGLIAKKVAEIKDSDQNKFRETVETELMSLHEGNIARYFIRPSQFLQWKNVWGKMNKVLPSTSSYFPSNTTVPPSLPIITLLARLINKP